MPGIVRDAFNYTTNMSDEMLPLSKLPRSDRVLTIEKIDEDYRTVQKTGATLHFFMYCF